MKLKITIEIETVETETVETETVTVSDNLHQQLQELKKYVVPMNTHRY